MRNLYLQTVNNRLYRPHWWSWC